MGRHWRSRDYRSQAVICTHKSEQYRLGSGVSSQGFRSGMMIFTSCFTTTVFDMRSKTPDRRRKPMFGRLLRGYYKWLIWEVPKIFRWDGEEGLNTRNIQER